MVSFQGSHFNVSLIWQNVPYFWPDMGYCFSSIFGCMNISSTDFCIVSKVIIRMRSVKNTAYYYLYHTTFCLKNPLLLLSVD